MIFSTKLKEGDKNCAKKCFSLNCIIYRLSDFVTFSFTIQNTLNSNFLVFLFRNSTFVQTSSDLMTKAVVQNKICAYVLVDMAFVYTIVRMIFCTKVEEVSDAFGV